VGEIQVYRPPGRPLPSGVYEFGIALFHEEDRGRGYGAEAISLLTGWLFRDAGATRVQTGTTVTNRPMRRLLNKLGFAESGTLDVRGVPHILYAVERPIIELPR
jgi:RimJ/RimL family protein N-acetyltransferase